MPIQPKTSEILPNINLEFPPDITAMNFNHVVRLGVGEVLVYPDGMDKPPVGEGLNRMATVTWAP